MDSKDKEIIKILKEDSRTPYTEIADRLDVSEGTIRNRVEKLEENDVIEKYTIETEKEQTAIVMVKVTTNTDFSRLFSSFPENIEFFEIAGEHDLVLKFSRESTEEMNKVVDKIRMLDNVKSTKTYPVLKRREK